MTPARRNAAPLRPAARLLTGSTDVPARFAPCGRPWARTTWPTAGWPRSAPRFRGRRRRVVVARERGVQWWRCTMLALGGPRLSALSRPSPAHPHHPGRHAYWAIRTRRNARIQRIQFHKNMAISAASCWPSRRPRDLARPAQSRRALFSARVRARARRARAACPVPPRHPAQRRP